MILILDTSNIEYIYLGLGYKSKIKYEKKVKAKFEQEEKLLISLKDFLSANKLKITDLDGLIVVSGPGSFSALRIGLAVANAIAWSFNKRIAGFRRDEFKNYQELLIKGKESLSESKNFRLVLPEYGTEPNINIKKEK